MHGRKQIKIRPSRKHSRQRRVLDLPCDLKLLIYPLFRRVDIVLERGNRGVNIIGQLGKLLIGAHIDHRVKVACRYRLQAVVDPLQIAGHLLFEHLIYKDKQRRIDQHFHEHHKIQRHIAVKRCVIRCDAVNDLLGKAARYKKRYNNAHQQPKAEIIAYPARFDINVLSLSRSGADDR